MKSFLTRCVLALTLVSALAACGSTPPLEPKAAPTSAVLKPTKTPTGIFKAQVAQQAPGDQTNLEVVPNLHVLTPPENAPAFGMVNDSVMTLGKVGANLENLEVGDYLNAGVTEKTPFGLLKRVTKLTDNTDFWTVEVVDASLEEVVLGGRLNQEAPLDPSTVTESTLAEGVTIPTLDKNYGREKDFPLEYTFNGASIDCGDGGKVQINGFIKGKARIYIDTDFEKVRFIRAPILNKPKLFEAGLKFEGKTQLKLSGKCSFKKEVVTELVNQKFQGFDFGYFPFFYVGVQPYIKISVGASGELFVQASYTYTFEGKRNDGVRWTRDAGWNNISESTGIDGKEDFNYSAGVRVRAFTSLGLGLNLYAKVVTYSIADADVYVEVKPYLEMLATIPPPKLCFYAGLDVALKANVSVISRQIKEWEKKFPDLYRKELLCKPGPVEPPPTLNAPCDNLGGAACVFDTRSQGQNSDGSYVESIAAYGKIWNYDLNGNPSAGNKTDIRSVARYASGPCASVPAGQPCVFDTRTLTNNFPGVGFVESLTAYGKYWNFDAIGNEWIGGGNGGDLRSVARFANGPCAFAPAGQPCVFDTRTLADYPGVGFLETITAYGRFWNFDMDGNEWVGGGNGTDLKAVPRYANGPCAPAVASGQPCTFDTFTMTDYPGAGFVQGITAYGKAYAYDINGNIWGGVNGLDLKSVPRFVSGGGTKETVTPPATPTKTTLTLPNFQSVCQNQRTNTPLAGPECEVTENYTQALSRFPDPAGLQYWLSSGTTGDIQRSLFVNSEEATALLQSIARACLLRDADQALLDTWRGVLMSKGGNMYALGYWVSVSAEARQKGDSCVLNSQTAYNTN